MMAVIVDHDARRQDAERYIDLLPPADAWNFTVQQFHSPTPCESRLQGVGRDPPGCSRPLVLHAGHRRQEADLFSIFLANQAEIDFTSVGR